jgi:glutathione S-transferase
MTDAYRIFGSELSPYSVKVRSWFRYKRVPHEWVIRGPANEAEFTKYAKLPLIPLVVTPEGDGLQDSTPIIETLEARFPDPSIHPAEPVAAFASALLEEYGDEWVNKPMFHYRWTYEADQVSAATRIARSRFGAEGPALDKAVAAVRERMVPRLAFVGSEAATRGVIEGSFTRLLNHLNNHLAARPFLFGARPSFGDFGLFAQIYEAATDPTPGALIRFRAPRVMAWCERMLAPGADGPFEAWETLAPTLEPLIAGEVAGLFLPWTTANAKAVAAGTERFDVTLKGEAFGQVPQKYHARSLAALKRRYADQAGDAGVVALAERTGCRAWLDG